MAVKRLIAVAVAFVAAAGIAAGIVYVMYVYPERAAGPEQPIPFSHRLHVTVKEIDCRFCHNTVDRSAWPGMPPVAKCLFCHLQVIPEHPQIRKLRAFFERGEPIPWNKVTWLPDHVQFQHDRHVAKGVACEECHGDVAAMDRVREEHEFNMGFCLDCHRARKAPTDCWGCHG